jgi:hypothetical protein
MTGLEKDALKSITFTNEALGFSPIQNNH